MNGTTSSESVRRRAAGTRGGPIRTLASAVAIILTVVLTACSTSSNTPTVTSSSPDAQSSSPAQESTTTGDPAGKEEVCRARDDLSTSMAALTDPALLTGGADGIKSALTQVQTSLTALAAAGKDDYAPQIDALQSALGQVQTAVGNLGNGNAATNLVAVGTAIGAAGTAASDLFAQLTAACGS